MLKSGLFGGSRLCKCEYRTSKQKKHISFIAINLFPFSWLLIIEPLHKTPVELFSFCFFVPQQLDDISKDWTRIHSNKLVQLNNCRLGVLGWSRNLRELQKTKPNQPNEVNVNYSNHFPLLIHGFTSTRQDNGQRDRVNDDKQNSWKLWRLKKRKRKLWDGWTFVLVLRHTSTFSHMVFIQGMRRMSFSLVENCMKSNSSNSSRFWLVNFKWIEKIRGWFVGTQMKPPHYFICELFTDDFWILKKKSHIITCSLSVIRFALWFVAADNITQKAEFLLCS